MQKALLEWRNNPVTREASHNAALISEDEHIQWLKNILSNDKRKLYVAEMDGIAVGTVRVDSESQGHELSWTVSPAMRDSGCCATSPLHHFATQIPAGRPA